MPTDESPPTGGPPHIGLAADIYSRAVAIDIARAGTHDVESIHYERAINSIVASEIFFDAWEDHQAGFYGEQARPAPDAGPAPDEKGFTEFKEF